MKLIKVLYRKVRLILIYSLFIVSYTAIAQSKQSNIWIIGNQKFDYNTSPMSVSTITSSYITSGRAAVLCDTAGLLKYCMSGNVLLDKDLQLIPGSEGISNVPGIFVPKPDNPNQYYIFGNRTYSIIDNTMNGGKGGIVGLNLKWNQNGITPLLATSAQNCGNTWLLGKSLDSLVVYSVTSSGIQKHYSYKVSNLGIEGFCFSPINNYLILPVFGTDTDNIRFCKFNRITGKPNTIISYPYAEFSVVLASCFSPDEMFLYLFFKKVLTNGVSFHLIQVPVISGVPDFANYQTITTEVRSTTYVSNMQLGLDGKIYQGFQIPQTKNINVIHNPNMLGVACNYQENAIAMPTGTKVLPTIVSSWLSANACACGFTYSNACAGLSGNFTVFNQPFNFVSYLWDFGNGESTTEASPNYTYALPGTYHVRLTGTSALGATSVTEQDVVIYALPLTVPIKTN